MILDSKPELIGESPSDGISESKCNRSNQELTHEQHDD